MKKILLVFICVLIPQISIAEDCFFLAEMAGYLTRAGIFCEFSSEIDPTVRQLLTDAKNGTGGTNCAPIDDRTISIAVRRGIMQFTEFQKNQPVHKLCLQSYETYKQVRKQINGANVN